MRPSSVRGIAIVAALLGITASWGAVRFVRRSGPWSSVQNLNGEPVNPFVRNGRKATALFFATTDCPVSNSYAPEIHRICSAYQPKGVQFYVVYVDPTTTEQAAQKHSKAYDFGCPGLMDTTQKLVHLSHASVTPEVALFSATGQLIYHGKIDDRAVDYGKIRSVATTHELRDAINDYLTGKPIPKPVTRPFGCYIIDMHL